MRVSGKKLAPPGALSAALVRAADNAPGGAIPLFKSFRQLDFY